MFIVRLPPYLASGLVVVPWLAAAAGSSNCVVDDDETTKKKKNKKGLGPMISVRFRVTCSVGF